MFKKILVIVLLAIFLLFPYHVHADDFKSDYQVEYYLTNNGENLPTKVIFNIKITNLRSDIYVKKFALSFPKNFIIHDIKVTDDVGTIIPLTTSDDLKTKIELEFNDPQVGRGTSNNIYLQFNQDNLFKINGNVWEVTLPTIENNKTGNYNIIVNLPVNTDKKISIAKPKPDSVSGNQIIWNNPNSRTVYAVFGNEQYYEVNLTYNLKNPKVVPVYMDIAFPPDTSYQKIYINNINPMPSYIYRDNDNNFLGRYLLSPSETKKILFTSVIEVKSHAQDNVIKFNSNLIEKQKKYLLTSNKYWNITDLDKIANIKTINDMYNFVTTNLKYNYKRVTTNNPRNGADKILKNPTEAVCVDFTDLFIALAREKGIMTREIQGYGFSFDPQLRPLSGASDILHSWPEYYDQMSKNWIAVDPTWENTSGIDYLSSLDLNHIAFVVHGKDPQYPLSAGMYKTENSKDISVKPINKKPETKLDLIFDIPSISDKINDQLSYKNKMIVTNNSNVYLYNIILKNKATNLIITPEEYIIDALAPFEKKEISFEYRSLIKNKKTTGQLKIYASDKLIFEKSLVIYPYYYELALKIALIILSLSSFFLIIKYIKRTKS